jgi:hypothetical protein
MHPCKPEENPIEMWGQRVFQTRGRTRFSYTRDGITGNARGGGGTTISRVGGTASSYGRILLFVAVSSSSSPHHTIVSSSPSPPTPPLSTVSSSPSPPTPPPSVVGHKKAGVHSGIFFFHPAQELGFVLVLNN